MDCIGNKDFKGWIKLKEELHYSISRLSSRMGEMDASDMKKIKKAMLELFK